MPQKPVLVVADAEIEKGTLTPVESFSTNSRRAETVDFSTLHNATAPLLVSRLFRRNSGVIRAIEPVRTQLQRGLILYERLLR
jgi:hypothetical protein